MGSESVKSSKYAFEGVFESTSDITDAFLDEAVVSTDSDLAVSTISESPFDSFFFSDFDFLDSLDEKVFDNAAVEEANLAARPLSTVYRLDSKPLANLLHLHI